MVSKLQQSDDGIVVSLPEDSLKSLGLEVGSEVSVSVNVELGQIIITPASAPAASIDPLFAQQVSEFIEQYRPALDALAK